MTKLYLASDIRHAKRWIKLRIEVYPEIKIVSSWIDFLKDGEPQGISDALIRQSWHNNLADIKLCDTLLLYNEPPTDMLRGAMFESGYAISLNKELLFVGDFLSLGSLHVLFRCFKTLEGALDYIMVPQ